MTSVAVCSLAGGGNFCQAEIEQLGLTALGDKNICGLDVAMDDALAVGGVERVGDLDTQSDQGFCVERPAFDAMLERLAFEKFHGDKSQAVLLVDFVNGADIGMIQSRGCLRFALKTAERLLIFGDIVGQELEGDEPAQLKVFGFVDYAHASAAQFFENPIVGDGLTEHVARCDLQALSYGASGEEVKISLAALAGRPRRPSPHECRTVERIYAT